MPAATTSSGSALASGQPEWMKCSMVRAAATSAPDTKNVLTARRTRREPARRRALPIRLDIGKSSRSLEIRTSDTPTPFWKNRALRSSEPGCFRRTRHQSSVSPSNEAQAAPEDPSSTGSGKHRWSTPTVREKPDSCLKPRKIFRRFLLELLAFPVVELLDPPDHPESPPEHLLRARIPADVVWFPRPPRQEREATFAGPEGVRDAAARRTRDDGAHTHRLAVVGPQLERAVAVEHDEELLLGGVHVRGPGKRAGVALDVCQPGPARAGCGTQVAAPPAAHHIGLHVGDVHDRRRTFRFRLRPHEFRLAVPRVAVVHLDPARDRPHRAAARQLAAREVLAGTEREHVEPLVAAADRVGLVEVLVDDAVAGADLVRPLVHPCQPRPAEHVEGLLRLTVHVRRRRHLTRRKLDPSNTAAVAAGRRAEVGPRAGHLAALVPPLLDIVPVCDAHGATLNPSARSRPPSPA